jgi:phosphoribosylaminoimidazole-succinocarboxamide synthase
MNPLIAMIIGSETDKPVVKESGMFEIWDRCGIIYDLSVISADRNPGVLRDHCEKMIQEGVKVFVGAAGMAARLPGTMAAHAKYHLPVIGVALPSEDFPNAQDALFSITRTPAGCPVLCTGVGKAGLKNAAIAAVQILANGSDEKSKKIREKLTAYFLNTRKEPQLGIKISSGEGNKMESKVLLRTNIPGGIIFARGKVRDTYTIREDLLLVVTTDRISAFDIVLPNAIPDKGRVLNQLSGFWFEKTRHLVPNHLVQVVDDVNSLRSYFESSISNSDLASLVGRSMIVRKAKRIDVECIARGYLSGSAWAEYKQDGTVAGLSMPKGLKESDKLPQILFTPTTKAEKNHDEPITIKQMEDMFGKELTGEVAAKTLKVYSFADDYARKRGIIIADTKMEFGIIDDKLSLIDELLTPDSSRFWDLNKFSPGGPQPSFDKQPVRDFLTDSGWNKEPPALELSEEVILATAERYRKVYERLTGPPLD